ncbi:hypothetical protein P152DRAFT_389865 [Eremomyces bilateralis CBS 781.70]|uniref:Cation chloride cotransporter n=1 Tax=Eremomyces bilateralis CBS 781.70 TaxID=1392243 RepID=A0A6G1GBL8_9PEZI|nr:uncharacterized protein P152DRAFT_389865 [Eremomyces bilateralis CBS 781.70]KAF1815336.1 hypothetical protein P152DRAFT_389865 [Eremomyces bilateralis CBS 781.70]
MSTGPSSIVQLQRQAKTKRLPKPRVGALPRPVGGSDKLGTFAGVFVPTMLNVLSILMFLRFGFILGQTGFLGTIGMLVICYAVNLLTTMSLSAIATNGTVRGGGTYYLISRSLGPEFGGSIGIVFYLGMILNTGMNAVGLIDILKENFGTKTGNWSHWMSEGFWWQYLWGSMVLLVCTTICLAGSGLFARASNGLWIILVVATISIPISTLFVSPFEDPEAGIRYTGLSWRTFEQNLLPQFTRGAAGSEMKGKETWKDVFGILFPATGGIFAGASMSGDLKHPSKAIPKGTLHGLFFTFILYALVILSLAFTVTRDSLYANSNVIAEVNGSGTLILMGEVASSFFSALMGLIGAAKLLQALARDNLVPGLHIFGQGTQKKDEPTFAIFLSYVIAQLTMLFDLNQIASLTTMAYLLTFLVMNLACFLLKISSAPNFRPSFHYFNWETAALGTVASAVTMFFVDGFYASGIIGLLALVFLVIHYASNPKPWGDVSQSLIYHQVRKYLLRLREEHVKFWRPQILLLVNDPRRQYKLIQFCNSLKKGGLYILGHVIVTNDFSSAVPEAKKQQATWTKYIDFSKIKAFVNIAINPMFEWGVRNLVLSAGLGGMRPNVVVMGFINTNDFQKQLIDIPSPNPLTSASTREQERLTPPNRKASVDRFGESLPTDANRLEGAVSARSYVTILEDLLLQVRINVAIGKGFSDLELPAPKPDRWDDSLRMLKLRKEPKIQNTKQFIDLWPIQMSAEIASAGKGRKKHLTTTNFDTYTLILQLGCILHTVPSWKRAYKLRIAVFVEYESDVEEERRRVTDLLTNLRMEATVLVFWLACGSLNTYEVIVNGKTDIPSEQLAAVNGVLHDEDWWQELRQVRLRRESGHITPSEELAEMEGLLRGVGTNWPGSSFQHSRDPLVSSGVSGLRNRLQKRRRASMSEMSRLGVTMGMQTHRLDPNLMNDSSSECSTSGSSDDDGLSDSDVAASENGIEDSRELPRISGSRRNTVGGFGSVRYDTTAARPSIPSASGSTGLGRRGSDIAVHPSAIKPEGPPRPADPESLIDTFESPNTSTVDERVATAASFPKSPVARPDPVQAPGPSIAFIDLPQPDHGERTTQRDGPYGKRDRSKSHGKTSIYSRDLALTMQSLPISFNDLPCRAQHMILNELMRSQSADTAVIFTTLPSPVAGTGENEEASITYLRDLEVLCEGCPPVLMVHSNSMTVTTNL